MLNRLCYRLGYLTLLLLIVQGLVMSDIGEIQAHGPIDSTTIEHTLKSELTEAHTHGHAHAPTDRHSLPHDSGSHFHETADRVATGIVIPLLMPGSAKRHRPDGFPLRRVFRIVRPPRPVIVA
jgi:hypothetical protein